MEKGDLKKFSEGLRRYFLLVEGKYDWIPVVHFVYWDNKEKVVRDGRADIAGPHAVDEWINLKMEEARKGYLTFGVNSESNFKLECATRDGDGSLANVLLLVYIGTEIKPKDEEIKSSNRAIIYRQKKLNLFYLKEMLDWNNQRLRSLETIEEMDKPPVFHKAIKEKYEGTRRVFSYLFKS